MLTFLVVPARMSPTLAVSVPIPILFMPKNLTMNLTLRAVIVPELVTVHS